MPVVGYGTMEIVPEPVRNFRQQLERQTSGDLAVAGRRAGKNFGDAAGSEAATGFRGRFSGAMRGWAPLAGLVAGAGLADFFRDGIEGASGLVEAGTKLNAIYGEAATEVQNFASSAASDLGQTRLQALDAAATFGTFGKAAGLAGSDLAGFSTELVSLSTDMASFFNTDVNTAIQAIGSGLRGEAEPLRQFGVLLDDATLRTEALNQGLIATTKQALTPQQKVLAAHAVIMRQTVDAQGDFERTSGGLANQQRKLTAQWQEMKTAVGSELLPAVTSFVSFLNDAGLPALQDAGGFARDAVEAFRALPPPVQAAAAAFIALQVAQRSGFVGFARSGVDSAGGALDGLRLRTMLAKDEYLRLRSASITVSGAQAGVSLGAGRATAALGALKVGAAGAGAALRTGLGGASALVGGPWGAAFIAGSVILRKFWQNQQESKARVEELTAALDKQTGAITDQAEEIAFKNLQDAGAIDTAKELGISLDLVRDAALGNKDALAQVNAELSRQQAAFIASAPQVKGAEDAVARFSIKLTHFRDALGDQNGELAEARDGIKDYANFASEGAEATEMGGEAFRSYAERIREARTELQKLIDREQKRALAAIQSQRDELALVTTMQAATKEAREGARSLDINTKAGQDNKAALLDLADQWANSTPKARAAIGGYEEMRKKFIEVATAMGGGDKSARAEAIKLTDALLKVPKSADWKYQSEGWRDRMREIQALKSELAALRASFRIVYTAQASNQQSALDDRRGLAGGGRVVGPGTGTSDSVLLWGSNGEYMQKKAAVDYYGLGFMDDVNNLRVPKYAAGGPVAAAPAAVAPASGRAGVTINIGTMMVQDYGDMLRKLDAKAHMAQMDGMSS